MPSLPLPGRVTEKTGVGGVCWAEAAEQANRKSAARRPRAHPKASLVRSMRSLYDGDLPGLVYVGLPRLVRDKGEYLDAGCSGRAWFPDVVVGELGAPAVAVVERAGRAERGGDDAVARHVADEQVDRVGLPDLEAEVHGSAAAAGVGEGVGGVENERRGLA